MSNLSLSERERLAEQAILAEYLRKHASSLGHSCHLATMAEERRDGLIRELAQAQALPESKVRDRVMGATVNVQECTWQVYQAALWVVRR